MQRDHSFIASTALSLQKRRNFTPSICTLTWRRSSPSRTIQFNVSKLSNRLEDISTNDAAPSDPIDDKSQRGEKPGPVQKENEDLRGNGQFLYREGALESGDNAGDMEAVQIQDVSLEGTLLSNPSDKHFLDALSKGWDDLSQFDPDHIPPEPEEQASPVSAKQPPDAEKDGQLEPENKVITQEKEVPTKKVTKKRGRKSKKEPQSSKASVSDETPKGRKRTKKVGKQKDPVIDPKELSEGENELKSTPRWYFVQVKPSCENNVSTSIRNLTQSIDGDDIVDVLVPMTKTLKLSKSGASTEKDERYFPGYILVLMRMDRISYGHMKRIPHVQGFMGDPNDALMNKDQPFRPPIPVSNAEMRAIFGRIQDTDVRARQAKTGFQLNDVIRVVSGSMEGSKGRVVEVKPDLDIINCKLMLFGRESLVELNRSQIEVYDEENARLEDRQKKSRDDAKQSNRSDGRRRRVDSSFGKAGKVDYASANVSSAADDLAQILLDDDDDSWDPLANMEGKFKKSGTPDPMENQNDKFSNDVDETDEPAADKEEGFQDVAILDDDNTNEAGTQDDFVFSETKGGDPEEPYDEMDLVTQGGSNDPDGLINSDDELDEFLRMESENDLWAPERDGANGKRSRVNQPKTKGNKVNPKDIRASGNLEIDPELKMVLDEIDQELDQEESRNVGKKQLGHATTGQKSSRGFTTNEFDAEKRESDWFDDVEFPFDLDATEEDVPPGVKDIVESSNSKKGKGKQKNKGQAVNLDLEDFHFTEFEEQFSTGLDDVGKEIVTAAGSEDIAQFDPSLIEDSKSDEEIVEEFKAQKKGKRKATTTGRRGRKRTPAGE